MIKKNSLAAAFLIICFLFGIWCPGGAQTAKKEELKYEDMENYLRTAEIVAVDKDLEAGRTEPWQITLHDGKVTRRGFFKHVTRLRPTLLPDSYKYELAAYELNKLLNLNLVPPVVEREIQGIQGSLSLFIEGSITEEERKRKKMIPPDIKRFHNILEDINVFENLTYNPRDPKDILIEEKSWKIWRVDFSQAFDPAPELLPGCTITRCSESLYHNLLQLDTLAVQTALKSYLNKDEIQAILDRKNTIIKEIEKLVNKKGEKSVLFYPSLPSSIEEAGILEERSANASLCFQKEMALLWRLHKTCAIYHNPK